ALTGTLVKFMSLKRLNILTNLSHFCSLFLLVLWLMPATTEVFANETGEYNRRATATAQILAGITPNSPDPALKHLVESETFKEHQQWMNTNWNQVRNRIQTMDAWRSHEIKISGAQKKNLVYPFSGPDLLNAYVFFPDHARYIFFSLERPGTLPDLESVTPAQFSKLLQDVRSAFRDIFERNYFITSYMTKQLTTPWIRGTVPVMAIMLALMNRRIIRIEPLDLFPDLTHSYDVPDAKRPPVLMRAVRVDFTSATNGSGIQQLYYVSLDAADRALEFYPDFLNWVSQYKPATVLIKSASYLLHDQQFSKTRTMILDAADVLVQDDTGIPFRFISQNPWQVKLYGRYHRPIRLMRYGYQKDLETAFNSRQEQNSLPFPFGYHWRGQQSGLIVAHR
ncbi:MAG TPA: hypothetical protein VFY96_03015, partial [Candidatus Binatia bacterium]|nr:hypothetical protein [Candidatus Binatia bacterium]